MSRAMEYEGHRRPSVKDVIPMEEGAFWMHSRRTTGACVQDADLPSPTVLTSCLHRPQKTRVRKRRRRMVAMLRRYSHKRRAGNVMDVDDARTLSPIEWGMIQGFPRSYRWLYGQGGLSRRR